MPGEMTLVTVSLSNLSITLPVIYSCMAKRPNCGQQVQCSFAVIFHIETSVLETLNVVYKQFFQASTSPPPCPSTQMPCIMWEIRLLDRHIVKLKKIIKKKIIIKIPDGQLFGVYSTLYL